MTFGKDEALRRAAAVRATFPKGKITVAQAKAMVMAMADSQIGYYTGDGQLSMYGNGQRWRTKGDWNRQVYWCALGTSWVFDQCFGADAAKAGVGWQGGAYNPVGFRATWLWREWFIAHNRWVGIENAQPGDISLQKWGRTDNYTDHVEFVNGVWNGSTLPGIGFNTSSGLGSQTSGAGVYRVARPRWPVVGIYRPDYEAIVKVYNAQIVVDEITEGVEDLTKYPKMLVSLGFTNSESGIRAFQKEYNLTEDGILGPNTKAALEKAMATLDDIYKEVTTVELSAGDVREIYGRDTKESMVVKQDEVDRLTFRRMYETLRLVRNLDNMIAAQNKVLEQLASGQGIDPTEIQSAVSSAITQSMEALAADVREALLAEGVAETVASRVVDSIADRLTSPTP